MIFIKYKEQGVVRLARVKTRDQPKQANKSEKEEVKKTHWQTNTRKRRNEGTRYNNELANEEGSRQT